MKNRFVKIVKGSYRNMDADGTYELIKPFKGNPSGGHVTVYYEGDRFGTFTGQLRIRCREADIEYQDENGNKVDLELSDFLSGDAASAASKTRTKGGQTNMSTDFPEIESMFDGETEEEAMERISDTFKLIDQLTEAACSGIVKGLIISGPPGIGKSWGVENTLHKENFTEILANHGESKNFRIIKGSGSPIGLFQQLYLYREKGQVIVLDDADDFYWDETGINLIKAALDTGHRRRLTWLSESRVLKENDIPDSFEYNGSLIFLTNMKFDDIIARGSKIAHHLEAMISRCHYLDLEINSLRDIRLRIKQIVNEGMLDKYGLNKHEKEEVVSFVFDNFEFFRERSLRTVIKVAEFRKAMPNDWVKFAVNTTFRRDCKYKWMRIQKDNENERKQEELELLKEPLDENQITDVQIEEM